MSSHSGGWVMNICFKGTKANSWQRVQEHVAFKSSTSDSQWEALLLPIPSLNRWETEAPERDESRVTQRLSNRVRLRSQISWFPQHFSQYAKMPGLADPPMDLPRQAFKWASPVAHVCPGPLTSPLASRGAAKGLLVSNLFLFQRIKF